MKIDGTSPFNTAVSSAAPAAAPPMPAAVAASAATPAVNPVLAQKPARPDPQKAEQAAKEINDFLKSASAGIEFQVDKQSDRVIVRVVDTETKQLIRQVPTEEMVAISHALDRMTGLLLAQKA
jgi:flagellar protein FlaG